MTTERPILFSAPMVRALLAGTKTQTRRVVKVQPDSASDGILADYALDANGRRAGFALWYLSAGERVACDWHVHNNPQFCPYGMPGEKLWVREAWAAPHAYDHLPPRLIPQEARRHYVATEDRGGLRWRPSIHMPRWASRILLEVTEVRVERLQAISEADALAEGIVETCSGYGLPAGEHFHAADPRQSYFSLWEAINGDGSVEANPWVWAVSFKRVEG